MLRPYSALCLLSFALTFGQGCAYLQSPRFEDGGRVLSQHYDVRGDISRGKLVRLSREAERIHSAMETFFRIRPRGRTTVGVFSESDDYREFLRQYRWLISELKWEVLQRTRGSHSPFHDEILFYHGSNDERVLAHEIAHRFVNAALPNSPPWLHEGLAGLLEQVAMPGGGESLGVLEGDLESDLLTRRALDEGWLPSLRSLLAPSFNDFYQVSSHGEVAVSFVRFLLETGTVGRDGRDLVDGLPQIHARMDEIEAAWRHWLEGWPRTSDVLAAFRRSAWDGRVRLQLPELLLRFEPDARGRSALLSLVSDPDPRTRGVSRWFLGVGSDDMNAAGRLRAARRRAALELGRRGDRRVVWRLLHGLTAPPVSSAPRRRPHPAIAATDSRRVLFRMGRLGEPGLLEILEETRGAASPAEIAGALNEWWLRCRLRYPPQI